MLVRAAAAQVEHAGGGVLDGIAQSGAHAIWEESRVWRTGGSGVETGSAQERRVEAEAAQRVALYRKRDAPPYDLKDMCDGQGHVRSGHAHGRDAVCERAHPPVFGRTLKIDRQSATLAVAGVKQTATIDAFKPPVVFQSLGGVAVMADNTWAAMQGKKKLKMEWEKSEHSDYNSDAYKKELQETARKPGKVVRENGNVDAAFAKGGKIVEAEYYAPLLAHASMEPPAALAVYQRWQGRGVGADAESVKAREKRWRRRWDSKKEDVTVNVTLLGGGFGRKSFPDFAVEAAVLAKKTGKPVKVVWSREDDIKFDSYHSVSAMYMKAALGADGKPTAWLQRTVFPPIGSTFEARNAVFGAGRAGAGFHRFAVRDGESSIGEWAGVRRMCASGGSGRWRIFITRMRFIRFTDELAHTAGKDPLEYTLALLGPDRIIPKDELQKGYTNYDGDYGQYPIDTARFKRVLQMAAEKARLGKEENGNGFGMGIAVHRSFLTYVASVVQVHMDDAGKVQSIAWTRRWMPERW